MNRYLQDAANFYSIRYKMSFKNAVDYLQRHPDKLEECREHLGNDMYDAKRDEQYDGLHDSYRYERGSWNE